MGQLQLPGEFREFLRYLTEERVEYLVVGGWAVALHGYPRFTADIDFWIRRDERNAERVIAALRRFDITDPGLTVDILLQPGKILRMGWPPLRIEILNQIDGVEFDACYPRAVEVEVSGVRIRAISRADLLLNKRASGRAKDLADLEILEGASGARQRDD